MKFKNIIFPILIAALMIVFVACDSDEPGFAEFENNFPVADMSGYEIEGEHRFYQVTMYEALQLLDDETFNGIFYFGGVWCPWCRIAIPVMHEASLANETDIFYVSRAHVYREGEWLEWDASMAWWLNEQIEMNWIYTTPDEDATDEEIENFEPEPIRPNIFVPQVVHLRNGIIVDSHRGTFDGHDPVGEGDDRHVPELTDEERATLFDVYDRIFFGTQFGCSLLGDTDACD